MAETFLNKKKRITNVLAVFLVFEHVCLIAAALFFVYSKNKGPGEFDYYYNARLKHQLRMDGSVPEGAVLFFGDSRTEELYASNASFNSVNFGIGGDTAYGLLKRIGRYKSLQHASATVIAIGLNDLKYRDVAASALFFKDILLAVPDSSLIVVSAILPVDEKALQENGDFRRTNKAITQFNSSIEHMCRQRSRCLYVEPPAAMKDAAGGLIPELHDGDGVHLSSKGARLWSEAIFSGIGKALASKGMR